MRKFLQALFTGLFFFTTHSQAQLISFQKIRSYTIGEIDTIVANGGGSLFFSPDYAVDLYKVLYTTPYKHPDSLVTGSGAIAIPKNANCALPLGSYFHGTVSNRTGVPSYQSEEATIGVLFASNGYFVAMPDYIGLGDSDPKVIIHPYIHAFSQGYDAVNILRAARQLADSLNIVLSDQLFLTGYSQGGFTTMAAHKLIEEQFSNEFQITASAPLSGAYDIKGEQADLIASDNPYPTPGYLPYILLSYHSLYDTLQQMFPDVKSFFKSPYDHLLPPLFYDKLESIGYINGVCTPVPKDVVKDSLVNIFISDTLHPLRQALAESHLLDWAPQAPVKLIYCHGDDQVTYLNSEKAYDSWTANGATQVEKLDLGNNNHAGCALPAFVSTKGFFDSKKNVCTGIESLTNNKILLYPNPADKHVVVNGPEIISELNFFDMTGRLVMKKSMHSNSERISLTEFLPGIYVAEITSKSGKISRGKVVVER